MHHAGERCMQAGQQEPLLDQALLHIPERGVSILPDGVPKRR